MILIYRIGAFIGCSIGWTCLIYSCTAAPQTSVKTLRDLLEIPQYSPKVKSEQVKTWQRRDLVFEQVRFQGRYRDWIPALIGYSSLASFKPLPAIICMPGIPSKKEDLYQTISQWVDKGFVVISIDRPYYGEREGEMLQAITEKGLLKVWGEAIYDLIRTIDYLESRPEIDDTRIGILGLSMGGMEALIAAGLDPRLKVVVSIGGQMSWEPIFAQGTWRQLFPGLPLTKKLTQTAATGTEALAAFEAAYPGFSHVDAANIIALVAPKPLLLMGGALDPVIPIDALTKTYNAGLVAYTEKASKDRLSLHVEAEIGHSFSVPMQEKALDWFEYWLIDHALDLQIKR